MDATDIRLANLRAVLARYRAGGHTVEEFAYKVGTNAAYISQMLGAKAVRKPGSKFCRKVEAAMELDHGFLDRDQSSAPFDMLSPEARELLALWSALPLSTQAHLKGVLKALAAPASPRQAAVEAAMAATTAAARAKAKKTPIR